MSEGHAQFTFHSWQIKVIPSSGIKTKNAISLALENPFTYEVSLGSAVSKAHEWS